MGVPTCLEKNTDKTLLLRDEHFWVHKKADKGLPKIFVALRGKNNGYDSGC